MDLRPCFWSGGVVVMSCWKRSDLFVVVRLMLSFVVGCGVCLLCVGPIGAFGFLLPSSSVALIFVLVGILAYFRKMLIFCLCGERETCRLWRSRGLGGTWLALTL